MVKFKKITEDNFKAITKMKVREEDKTFVAENLFSLAQAWLYKKVARPYAIYNKKELVGFIMIAYEKDLHNIYLWRLMIDEQHQNKGYGKQTMEVLIEMAKKDKNIYTLSTSYVPGNDHASYIYKKMGMIETGEMEEGEHVLRMDVKE